MTNPRKKIILNEILFWKQNKLLPEHYCDFLAALYTEGADIEELEPVQDPKQAILPSEKRKMILLIASLCIAIITVLAIYFTIKSFTLVIRTPLFSKIGLVDFTCKIQVLNPGGLPL